MAKAVSVFRAGDKIGGRKKKRGIKGRRKKKEGEAEMQPHIYVGGLIQSKDGATRPKRNQSQLK